MDIPLKEVKGNLKLLKRNLDKNNLKSSKKEVDLLLELNGKNMSYTNDEKKHLIDWCKVFTSKTGEELEKSSKKVLSKKNTSKLVDEVIRLSGDDEVMIEFDMNSKRDLELKSEYDEMASMFKEKEQKLKEKKHNNQIEIAKNLLKLNLTTDNISLATGLTKEEINKLKE